MRMSRFRVLIADSDPKIRAKISESLQSMADDIFQVTSKSEAFQVIEKESLDLIITDIMLPDLEICRQIRERSNASIIVTGSLIDNDKYKALCLGSGAAKYLAKPFTMEEFLAFTAPIIKRNKLIESSSNDSVFVNGDLKIEFAARRVTRCDREIWLTPTEFNILQELALNAGKVLTHDLLIKTIWGAGPGHAREYLRIFVNRLRKKLEPDPGKPDIVMTVPWVGYKLILLNSK
jgi:two-component system, OmpR family, KDP operon response regulator KdpE